MAQASRRPTAVDEGVVIEDVTVVSPERPAPLPHATVVLREGRIAAIATHLVAGSRAQRIDGRGRFLIPGLIDSHVHVGDLASLGDEAAAAHPELVRAYETQRPRSYLAFGFTTLVDLGLPEGSPAWFTGSLAHPSLLHCGPAAHTLGGYGALRVPGDAGAANTASLIFEPTQARDPPYLDPGDYAASHAVDRVVAAGGVCVKAFVEPGFGGVFHWPVPSTETLATLRAESRRRKLLLFAHANGVEAWRAPVDARVDVIAHGLWHWPGDRTGSWRRSGVWRTAATCG